jgi:hypothetical protein
MTVRFTDCFRIVKTYSNTGKDNYYLQNQNILLMQMREEDGKLFLINHEYHLLISTTERSKNLGNLKVKLAKICT